MRPVYPRYRSGGTVRMFSVRGSKGKPQDIAWEQSLRGGIDVATDERLQRLEAKYEGYKVVDNDGSSIGKVDDLFVDEDDREEYVGVKMGLFGLSGTALIPMEITRTNEREKTIMVQESKERVKDAPSYSDQRDMTPEYESGIRRHFGLESSGSERGSYGQYSDTNTDRGDREGRGDRGEHTESSGVPAGDTRGGDDRDRRSSGEESGDYREGSREGEGSGVPAETGGRGDSPDYTSESRESSGESDMTTGGRPGEESGASEEGGRTRIRRRSRRREESSFSEEEEETERI